MPRLPFKKPLLVCACCALFAPAHADVFTWDGSGGNNNWSTASNWDCDIFCLAVPSPGDALVFQGSTRLFPFNDLGSFVVDWIRFDSPNFSLGGNAFTVQPVSAGGGFIWNNSSGSQQIANFLTINGDVSFVGGGMTFSGGISLGSSGSLTVEGHRDTTFNNVISGGGDLVVAGTTSAAAVRLNASNSYSGDTIVQSGTLRLGILNALADASRVSMSGGTLDLNSFNETIGGLSGNGAILLGSATLRVNQALSGGFTGPISGTGKLVKAGTGSLTLSGGSTYGGGTEILQGTLSTPGNGLPDAGSVLIQGGVLNINGGTEVIGALTLEGGQIAGTGALQAASFELRSGTVSAALAGSSAVNKTTSGTVRFSGGNHTYTGGTFVSAGTLELATSNTLPSAGSLTITGGASVTAFSSTSNPLGALSLVNGSLLGSGTLLPSSIDVQQGTIGATLGGSAALVKSGPGTLTLSGPQSYSGATRVEGGVLGIGSGGGRVPGGTALVVNAGATFAMNGFNQSVGSLSGAGDVTLGAGVLTVSGADSTFSGVISGNGMLLKAGAGRLTLAGPNTYTGQTQVAGGTLALGASGVLADTSSVLVAGGTLDIGNAVETVGSVQLGSGTISGGTGVLQGSSFALESGLVSARLGGPGGLTKSTAGVAVLAAQNIYAGGTGITDGTLRMQATNALPTTTALFIAGPGTLDLAGFGTTAGSLSGSGSVALGTGASLAVGANNLSTTFTGTLSGAPDAVGNGGVRKIGSGTLVLSGPYQHSGVLAVEGGTLDLPNGLVSSGDFIVVGAGARLLTQGFVNRPIDNFGTVRARGDLILGPIGGSGGVIIEAGGLLDVASHRVQLINRSFASVIAGTVQIGEGGRLTSFDQGIGLVVEAGGAISASGNAFVDGNLVNDGLVNGPSAEGKALVLTDNVTGTGNYGGNVAFLQDFSPGASPARVSMNNATFASSSNLIMELAGAASYDSLDVDGLLDLEGGVLTVALIDGFAPQAGQRFDLFDFAEIDGAFGHVLLPQLAQGLFWSTSSLYLDGSIAVAIPEPESYALLLAGIALLGFAARRTRTGHLI